MQGLGIWGLGFAAYGIKFGFFQSFGLRFRLLGV